MLVKEWRAPQCGQALETSAETVTLALEQTVREIELAEKQKAEAIVCQVVDELFHDWELGQGFGYPARVLVFIGRAADRISRVALREGTRIADYLTGLDKRPEAAGQRVEAS